MIKRPTPVESIRILVAEDNPVNQVVLVKMLARMGYAAPTVVANGQEALAAVKDADFDIIFMDCEMPVFDGVEATRLVRELPTARQLPIIGLSAHRSEEHEALCIAAGMSDYLPKPINVEALRERLSHWL
jgi:CheY-like chemotaxis protein